MTILSREEILARLEAATIRMARVRRAAQLQSIIRAGDEPAPAPTTGELGEPSPEFRGEPPRTGTPTG